MATGYYYPPAKDKGGANFTLAPGEYLVGCPYDESHRALNTRYERHLYKCRRNYAFKQSLKGEDVIKLSCQFNYHHVVPAQEILLHEHICGRELRAKRSHDIAIRVEEIRLLREEVKRTGVEQNEKLEALLNITPPLGVWPNLDVVVKGVMWADPQIAKEKGKSPFSKKLLDEIFKSSYGPTRKHKVGAKLDWYTKGPGATLDYSKGPLPPQPHELAMTKSKFDEEEDWDKGNNQPVYDWMENFKTLDVPLLSFPPGLSKMERKLFVIKNQERVKTQMGWFVPEPEQNSADSKDVKGKIVGKEKSS